MVKTLPYYRPWSPQLLNFALEHASKNLLMLDVQLGSNCNACCPRCDSACGSRREAAELDVDAVVRLSEEMAAECLRLHALGGDSQPDALQGYICGLGEPTAAENRAILKALLRRTNMRWAIFTNGIYWDNELSDYLRAGILAVQVQHDSDDVGKVQRLMGVARRKAEFHLQHRKLFYEIAQETQGSDGGTDVCGSQVPQQTNLQELPQLTDCIIAHGGFPLIAELEESGNCVGERYQAEKVEMTDLRRIKEHLVQKYGWRYDVPICPAVFGALHVNNRNQVTVDAATGWSCGWPLMQESTKQIVIGDIRTSSYRTLADRIIGYRKEYLEPVRAQLRRLEKQHTEAVFGGCGGTVQRLLRLYLSVYDKRYGAR